MTDFFSVVPIIRDKNQQCTSSDHKYLLNEYYGQPVSQLIKAVKKKTKSRHLVLFQNGEQIPANKKLDINPNDKIEYDCDITELTVNYHYTKESEHSNKESKLKVSQHLSISALKSLISKTTCLRSLSFEIFDSNQKKIQENQTIKEMIKTTGKSTINIRFNNPIYLIQYKFKFKIRKYTFPLPAPYNEEDIKANIAVHHMISYDAIILKKDNTGIYVVDIDKKAKPSSNGRMQPVAFTRSSQEKLVLNIKNDISFYEVAVHIGQCIRTASSQIAFSDQHGKRIDKGRRVKDFLNSTPIEYIGTYTLYVYSEVDQKTHKIDITHKTVIWFAQKSLLSYEHLPSHYRFYNMMSQSWCNLNHLAGTLPLGFENKAFVSFKPLPQPVYVIPIKSPEGSVKRITCSDNSIALGELIFTFSRMPNYSFKYNYATPMADRKTGGEELDIFAPISSFTEEIYRSLITPQSNTNEGQNSIMKAVKLQASKNEAWFLFKYQNQKPVKLSFKNPTKITVGTIRQEIQSLFFPNQNPKAMIQLRYHDNLLDDGDSFAFKSEQWDDAIIIEDKVDTPVKKITIGSKEYLIEMKKEETLFDLKLAFINKYCLNCSPGDINFYSSSPSKPLKRDEKNPPERIYAAFQGNGRLCTIILHNPAFEQPFIIVGDINDKNNIAGQISRANGMTLQANDITPTKDGFTVTFPNPAQNITFEFPSCSVTVNDANKMMIQDALKQKNIYFSPSCIKQVVFKLWHLPIPLDIPCLDGVPPNCPIKVEFQQNNVPISYSNYTFYFKELETIPAVQTFIQDILQGSHVEIQLNTKKLNSNEQLKIGNGYQLSIRLSVKIMEKGSTQPEQIPFEYVSTILDLKKQLSQYRSNSFISLSSSDIIIYDAGVPISDENARLITFKNLSYEVIKKQLLLQLHFEKSLCNYTSQELQFDFSKTIGDLLQTVRSQFGIFQEIVAGSVSSLTPKTIYDNQTTLQAAVESKGNVIYIFKQQTNNTTGIEAGDEDDNANYIDTIEEEEEENDADPVTITEDPLDQDSFMLTQTIDYTKTRFERIKVTSAKYKFRSNLSERPYKVRIYKDETVEMMKDKIAAAFDYDQSKLSVYDSITNTLLDDKMVLNPEIVNNMELFVYVHSQSTRPSGENPGDEDIEEYEYEYD